MTDLRKNMIPRHLELLMFLRSNRHLRNELVDQKVILAANDSDDTEAN